MKVWKRPRLFATANSWLDLLVGRT